RRPNTAERKSSASPRVQLYPPASRCNRKVIASSALSEANHFSDGGHETDPMLPFAEPAKLDHAFVICNLHNLRAEIRARVSQPKSRCETLHTRSCRTSRK